ncbi:MAG: ectoine hydroxylase-related dioxygenase (phytanoyl-CoA dioxygenase family) [Candidatus Aldehydirespiratoraceae bacterium]|jgi:ectoine hydroxylase-related dioxygenase (phytanoyl-CoA dioxygenase family)
MTSLPTFKSGAPIADVLSALDETGGVILRDLIEHSSVTQIVAEVRPHLESADPEMPHVNDILQEFFAGVRSVTGLTGKSATFVDDVLLHPSLLGVADAIIGPNSASIALNVAHLVAREPGAQRQWIHRDQEVWSFLPQPHPEVEVSVIVALSDFTVANGATALVPGSHRWDKDRRPEEHEVTYAEMPAGSALLYLGSTLHAGGRNSTNETRPGVHMSYVAGWLRTEENNCLATPPSVAAKLPRRAQELLGYAMHDAASVGGGYLGCVDLQDPVDLLVAGALTS